MPEEKDSKAKEEKEALEYKNEEPISNDSVSTEFNGMFEKLCSGWFTCWRDIKKGVGRGDGPEKDEKAQADSKDAGPKP